MTDCCGADLDAVDYDTCPDCNHKCCEDCVCSPRRGSCHCKHGLRGDARTDRPTQEDRDFLSNMLSYFGPFKPLAQVRMERDLAGNADYGEDPKARVATCGYASCNEGPNDGPTKLTDENIGQFVLCDKCKSVAYCSGTCRDADKRTSTWNMWDGEMCTHEDLCEEYMDNSTLPYVGYQVRMYRQKYGHYPHPLGGDKK